MRVQPDVGQAHCFGDGVGFGAGGAGVRADRLHRRLFGDVPVDRPALPGQQVAELVQHRAEIWLSLPAGLAATWQVEAEAERLLGAWVRHPFTLTVKMDR